MTPRDTALLALLDELIDRGIDAENALGRGAYAEKELRAKRDALVKVMESEVAAVGDRVWPER